MRMLKAYLKVIKQGNGLAIRLPIAVVKALGLKDGDDVEIVVAGAGRFKVKTPSGARKLLARLRKYRGRLPADFKFDRLGTNARP